MPFPFQTSRILGLDAQHGGTERRSWLPWRRQPSRNDATLVGLRDAVLSGWYQNPTGEVYRGVPIGPEDVVVDVGCGEGGTLAFCARRGAHVIAIDLDADALAQARAKIEPTAARAKEFHVAPAESLPVADGSATRVICTEVLEHVEDPHVALRELHRIGADGSLYLISVPDPVQESVQQKVAPDSYFRHPNHVRIIQREEFRALVEGAGLEVVSHGTYGFYWSVWWTMFWACKVDIANPQHPALDHWARSWEALLSTPEGPAIKVALDSVLPKSQVIVARKSGPTHATAR